VKRAHRTQRVCDYRLACCDCGCHACSLKVRPASSSGVHYLTLHTTSSSHRASLKVENPPEVHSTVKEVDLVFGIFEVVLELLKNYYP
jgi:hypothetical protein